MLKEIMKTISKSPYLSKKEISEKLDFQEGFLEQAFSDLLRMGYLEKQVCDSSCGACPVSYYCSKNSTTIEYWKITEKGYNLIRE